ncbi:Hpt domain-containing protein [Piscinibacter sakaiensis]|uniref:Hpt domain-containing protein n=1 Tax=Piscinibacter sakaiensis TaxID=1547922 RepID=UPI003AABFF99
MPFSRRPKAAASAGNAGDAGAGASGSERGAILDPESLQRLRELDPRGDARLLEKVIDAFCSSTARLLPQLREAAAAANLGGVRHVAHTLKSSSASLGALQLSRLCADLEQQIRDNAVVGLDRQVEQIGTEIAVVIQALDGLKDAAQ